jgi:hypothetical protein
MSGTEDGKRFASPWVGLSPPLRTMESLLRNSRPQQSY